MSTENKNFIIKNYLNKDIEVLTVSQKTYNGFLVGVDEHMNLLLKNGSNKNEQE